MRDGVLIYLNGQRVLVEGDDVFSTVVEFLRARRGLTGTKVGCGEGDCGACTVMVGRPVEGTLRYRTVSSCLQAMHQLDGTHVVTIEGLTPPNGLSPIQRAMVEHHGSQCGFCTPGMVAALEGVFEGATAVDLAGLRTGLTGNLCRCTGYLPILEAGLAVDRSSVAQLNRRYPSREMTDELAARVKVSIRFEHGGRTIFRPVTLDEAITFLSRHPRTLLVAGGTETGLTRSRRGLIEPPAILSLGGISELGRIAFEQGTLSVGANVTWTELEEFCRDRVPLVHALTNRFGSPQIRNAATLVGNIAHGSPVADSLCFLLISEAELVVAGPGGRRRVKIEGFHRGPKQTALGPCEIITRVVIPLPDTQDLVKLFKISKRKEIDTSTFRRGHPGSRSGTGGSDQRASRFRELGQR